MTRKSKLTSWLLEFQEVSGICYFLALLFVFLDRCIRLLVQVCLLVRSSYFFVVALSVTFCFSFVYHFAAFCELCFSATTSTKAT